MDRIAKFEKVSFSQFEKDYKDTITHISFLRPETEEIKDIYDDIKLPARSTNGSAGYDFYSPMYFILEKGEDITIPTGIRCRIEEGWALIIFARSGLGFKYYTRSANLLPIIDSDYFFSDNEGHIFLKIRNEGGRTLVVNRGDKIMQGVFLPFGITEDDDVDTIRNGGFGSTGK